MSSSFEAMACVCMVGTMQDEVEISGMVQCTREVDTIVDGIRNIINDYEDYSKKARAFAVERDWINIFKTLEQYYYEARDLKNNWQNTMKDRLVYAYSETDFKIKEPVIETNEINLKFEPNPIIEILGEQ